MEWRTIPGFEDYEVTLSGHVRRRDTRYRVSRVGSRYRLRANGQLHKMLPAEIVALAFPGPEVVERLRARVTELEQALRQAREGNKAATAPVASPKRPQPSAPPAKPQAAVRKERNAEPRVKADTVKSLRASRPCPPQKKQPATSQPKHHGDARLRAWIRPEHPISQGCPWQTGALHVETAWDWAGIV